MKKPALILAILMAFSAVSCSSKAEEQEIVVPIYEADKANYKTETAEIGDITEKYYVDGVFDYPYAQQALFKVDGQIKSVDVEDGQEVAKGDLLCEVNSDDLDSQIEEKQVYLEQAQKTVNTLKSSGGSATELELAETELELVQLEYDKLVASLDDYKVYAPCDGVFSLNSNSAFGTAIDEQRGAEKLITVGAAVTSGQQLGNVSDMSQKYLVADVFDNALENVNFGTKLTLTQDLAESTGKVIDIIYSDSGGMTTYSYVISVDNDTAFDSYQKVSCCFDVYSKVDTVTVPSDAVKQTNDRAYVNLLIDGTKIEQDVEIGIVDDDKTEILSGLSGGEEVIIN